ncbi:hypothetical protein [Arthrobacter sp. VKM Ac-2550]|uniref:hypothetical protein n=1 Tax=Crystallibacter permensis TaxID=1938888 RepID=UPI00222722E7|nr:hypothetical protein [Arthrobacter sp. VKM Ac-2550]MCW2132898.1 hypothetical protein [Arthrobacter sp. VKM Ac-2550]
MRLYRALCAALEAYAANNQTGDAPQGDVFSQAEHAHAYTSQPEMHSGHRGISLDYDEDEGGVYRSRPISLRWTPKT